MRDGRARYMGLGPANVISLKDARQRSLAARRLLLDGTDPIDLRKAARTSNAPTFKQVAERYVAAQEAGWKNAAHRQQWRSTLKNYCYPVLGNLPITAIDTDLVLKVLEFRDYPLAEQMGNPPLEAGIYALCQMESEAFDGNRGAANDEFWARAASASQIGLL